MTSGGIVVKKIPTWQNRPPGPDLVQHSWVKDPDGYYYRLCDYARWMELPEVDQPPEFSLHCMECGDVLDSSRFVFRRGPLPFRQKDARGPVLPTVAKYKKHNMSSDQSVAADDDNMIHMNTLIAFALLNGNQQLAFLRERKARTGGGQNRFLSIVKRLHRDTHDITQLENHYRVFVTEELSRPEFQERCRELIERYIDSWNRLDCIYTPPPPAHRVTIQGLPILVNPEVGARPREVQLRRRLIKLWLRPEPVSDAVYSMAAYLMDCLGRQYEWAGTWRLEVWDIRRRGVVSSPWDPRTEIRVQQAARRYVELWGSL